MAGMELADSIESIKIWLKKRNGPWSFQRDSSPASLAHADYPRYYYGIVGLV